MSMSDPVADMLTRIRNAHMAALEKVDIPHSKLKGEIARVLKREGYILDFAIEGGKRTLRVFIKRVSRPGRRVFVSADDLPRVLSGLGTAILSTSSGLMTDKEARKQHVGGEVVCSVW
jgi:small subunit ribosomal protein S8